MRQAGYLAAAGIYALSHHVDRLKEDHRRAQEIGALLESCSWVREIFPVETNIVIFEPDAASVSRDTLLVLLEKKGLRVSAFGKNYMRMVTHLDFSEEELAKTKEILSQI